jgi:hypothetical protein
VNTEWERMWKEADMQCFGDISETLEVTEEDHNKSHCCRFPGPNLSQCLSNTKQAYYRRDGEGLLALRRIGILLSCAYLSDKGILIEWIPLK